MTKEDCEALRRELKPFAEKVRALWDLAVPVTDSEQEAAANLMLAYRHLEDASMRLGKTIQAIDGGVSVYDRTQTPRSAA
jgi:hypothetical protein